MSEDRPVACIAKACHGRHRPADPGARPGESRQTDSALLACGGEQKVGVDSSER